MQNGGGHIFATEIVQTLIRLLIDRLLTICSGFSIPVVRVG